MNQLSAGGSKNRSSHKISEDDQTRERRCETPPATPRVRPTHRWHLLQSWRHSNANCGPCGKMDGKRRTRRRLDLCRGRGEDSREHCCTVASARRRCGCCHHVDRNAKLLATATGAAWKIEAVQTDVVDHESVGAAQKLVGLGAIARSEPPRRVRSDER
jgi:hypothetical protein